MKWDEIGWDGMGWDGRGSTDNQLACGLQLS
jgi:hypothetical protein